MAIITDITTDSGYVFRQQYCRPDSIQVEKVTMTIYMGVYESHERASEGGIPHRVEMVHGPFDINSERNLWQQAYSIMKSKWPEYTDI